MLQLQAMLVATMVIAAVASPPDEIAGTMVSISAGREGTTLVIDTAGARTTVVVAPTATVQERATGESWSRISLAALKPYEPLRVHLDADGRATAIDAEYATVDIQSVVARDGYVIGTDGIARRLVGAASAAASIPLGAFVRLRTDPATGDAFDVAVSSHPFAAASNAAAVAVTFDVRVPVNTPPDSIVYVATNQQRWTPSAIRLSPAPGNRWTGTIMLAGGTTLQYKYTRGSWSTGERDASGADIPNRTLTVGSGAKTQSVSDVVVRWADLPS